MGSTAQHLTLQKPLSGGLRLFLQFAYLQSLDVMTTLSFLLAGVQEANPMVNVAMRFGGSPLAGLIAVKLAALILAAFCLQTGRLKLLRRVNWFFAVLVAWNMFCLILGLGLRMNP